VNSLTPDEIRRRCDLAYLDPPYTKDQYSRFYHVFETLHAYRFTDSHGEGRLPTDRATSDFCYATRVETAFRETAGALFNAGVPVLVSYPSNGLLSGDRGSVPTLLASLGELVEHRKFSHRHSRLGGGRSGPWSKEAEENLLLVKP
jgi:adenine-specific DNA-methyltransferase